MEYKDIQRNIILNTDDVDSFISLCKTSKSFYDICNSDSFWQDKYYKNEIPLNKYHNNYISNILEYSYSLKCLNKTLEIIDYHDTFTIYILGHASIINIFSYYDFYEDMVKVYFLDNPDRMEIYYDTDKYVLVFGEYEYYFTYDDIFYIMYQVIYSGTKFNID